MANIQELQADIISNNLSSALNLGIKMNCTEKTIANKREITRLSRKIRLVEACNEFNAITNQPEGNIRLPNIFAVEGITCAFFEQIEDLNKRLHNFLIECYKIPDTRKRRRPAPRKARARAAGVAVEEEEVDYEAMMEMDIQVPELPALPQIQPEQESLTLLPDHREMETELSRKISDEDQIHFETEFPLVEQLEPPQLAPEIDGVVPEGPEVPIVEEVPAPIQEVPEVPETPQRPNQTIIMEEAPIPRQLGAVLPVRIVDGVRSTQRRIKIRDDIEENYVDYIGDFHDFEEFEFVWQDDNLLVSTLPEISLIQIQDLERVIPDIEIEEPSVIRGMGVAEPDIMPSIVSAETSAVVEPVAADITNVTMAELQPIEVPNISVLPEDDIVLPDSSHLPPPESIFHSSYDETDESSETLFALRRQHILSFKNKYPGYNWTIFQLTPAPHSRFNITVTFMCLIEVHREREVKFNCDDHGYLETIQFINT